MLRSLERMTTMYRLLAKTALLAWAAFACHAQSADPRDRPSGPPSAPAARITGPSGNTVEVQGPAAAPSVGPFEGRNSARPTETSDTRRRDRMRPGTDDSQNLPPSAGASK